ncbi:MAG: type III pantothenate kinase [Gammaproteobacteria bacterium]|nr:type III pantothenate kinase [Gammaproteobacteria bacterium]
MTELLIDIGNSRSKWASWHAGRLGAISSGDLDALLQCPPPARAWVSCVGHPEQLARLVAAWPACQLQLARSELAAAGVINGYRDPSRLGVDRWLALLAARCLSRAPQLVVDAGTAITLDLLDEFGQHKGGWIAPGFGLLRHSLTQGTAAVRPAGEGDDGGFGRDTAAAVNGGCAAMLVGVVDEALQRASRLLGSRLPLRVVVSGGDGPLLAAARSDWRRVDNLVLRGLAVVAAGHS